MFDIREGLFTDITPDHPLYLDHEITFKFFNLLSSSFANYHSVIINEQEKKKLLQSMVSYFEIHQTHGGVIRSHKILEEILH